MNIIPARIQETRVDEDEGAGEGGVIEVVGIPQEDFVVMRNVFVTILTMQGMALMPLFKGTKQ
jgi:hypothetical protein